MEAPGEVRVEAGPAPSPIRASPTRRGRRARRVAPDDRRGAGAPRERAPRRRRLGYVRRIGDRAVAERRALARAVPRALLGSDVRPRRGAPRGGGAEPRRRRRGRRGPRGRRRHLVDNRRGPRPHRDRHQPRPLGRRVPARPPASAPCSTASSPTPAERAWRPAARLAWISPLPRPPPRAAATAAGLTLADAREVGHGRVRRRDGAVREAGLTGPFHHPRPPYV